MTDSTARRRPVLTLNDLSTEQLAAAKAALAEGGPGGAAVYLSSLVDKCNLAYAARFIDDVLLGSADVRTWGYEDRVLVPDPRLEDLLTRPVLDLLRPLDDIEGTRWVRVRPKERSWFASSAGAPGVLMASCAYWLRPPLGISDVIRSNPDDVERIADLEVAARRWLTLRIAERLRFRAMPATPSELTAALGVTGQPTRDVEIALAALHREQTLAPPDGIPGFRGPDAWFAGS